jgi:protein TonB
MNYLRQQRHPLQNASGLAAVAVLHIGLIYALLNGLGTAITGRIAPPTTARIVDIRPPPPPVPPMLPAPDLPAPTLFVPKIDVPQPPPPLPRAPVAVGHTPAPLGPIRPTAHTAEQDVAFSPSAILGGAPAPSYPETYEDAARAGQVTVDCTIETDGNPAGCRVVKALGGAAFAAETLRWLTGPGHPVYKPALRGGVAQREEHQWVVLFEPPAANDGYTR